jgi:hypothetical protein
MPATLGEYEKVQAKAERDAAGKSFPELSERVADQLAAPLYFTEEFRSMIRVRNCLEHGRGRVRERDLDPGSDRMTLSFPHLQPVARIDGVDTPIEGPMFVEAGTEVRIRTITLSREYELGEPVLITSEDFFRIAQATSNFAADLARALSKISLGE